MGAVVAIALTLTSVLTFALKTDKNTPKESEKVLVTYYFQYTSNPGNESDPTLWQNVSSGFPACGNANDGCLIQVDESYTTLSGGVRILNQDVPVVTVGSHENPDTSDPMILSASNKNP